MKAQDILSQLAVQELKRQLSQGQITAQELTRRLSRAIDDELMKGPQRMDSAFVRACEDLLFELNAPASKLLPQAERDNWYHLREKLHQQRPQPMLWPRLRRAAVALSLVLVVGAGLWLSQQRPAPERKHLSTNQGSPRPSEDAWQGVTPITMSPTVEPSPTAEPTSVPTPNPTPTLLPVTEQPLAPEPLPIPAGREKFSSLQVLKQSAPKRWQQRYEVNGRVIEVDAPIIMPEVDRLPLYEVNWVNLKQSDVDKRAHDLFAGTRELRFDSLNRMVWTVARGDRSYFDGPGRPYGEGALAVDQQAQNSDYPKDAPEAFVKELFSKLKIDTGPLIKDAQLARSGLYQMAKNQGSAAGPDEPYADYLDFDKPIPGYETGSYRLSMMQTLGGLPLFPGGRGDLVKGDMKLEPHIFLHILNEQEFRLRTALIKVEGQREADLPLISPELVIKSAERLIKSGQLIRVDSIELGYMLFQAQHLRQGQHPDDALMLAVPTWRIRGIRRHQSEDQPLTAWDTRYFLETQVTSLSDSLHDLRFNAQTGEYMVPENEFPTRVNPAILTWDQLESEEEELKLFEQAPAPS